MNRLSDGQGEPLVLPIAESVATQAASSAVFSPAADSLLPVMLTREDILAIEAAAYAQITAGAVREGFRLIGRCLDWRYRSGIGGEPDNVVDLHGYSKRAPCA